MNYRVSASTFHCLHRVNRYSKPQARSPIFDTRETEPQWQAFMELDAASLNLKRN